MDARTKQTTKHTHPVIFGRKEAECPRCEELKNGAAPIQWAGSRRREIERQQIAAIRQHDFAACAAKNGVCTHFDY